MKPHVRNIAVLIFILLVGRPVVVRAVSYTTVQEEREEKTAKGIKVKGEYVCLFESGTGDIKRGIKAGDILVVYRNEAGQKPREVGKIKVLLYLGDDYLKAEVIEGEARNGDVAKKGDAASLIVPIDDRF